MNATEYNQLKKQIPTTSKQMYQLLVDLYPICRSITGNGVRKSLNLINEYIPLQIHEVPTGTKVFDWNIPMEWNINDAYIVGPNGKKIIDFQKSNLHVLNYSVPVKKKASLEELKKHVFTLPEYPDSIPYLTSYYNENWGFCMSHKQFLELEEGEYEIVIDSSLKQGSLTYGEYFIQGKNNDEIIFSCYICHPSMCNDNLSGIVLITMLAQMIKNFSNNYSYRFLFIPETIGSITWLALNENKLSNVRHGLVVTCVGDSGKFTYKKTRSGNEVIDNVVHDVLAESKKPYKLIDFFPTGSDERQFCSPGINLPFGSLMRTPYAKYAEYHTSADNLEFVKNEFLSESLSMYLSIIAFLEKNFIQSSKQDRIIKQSKKTNSQDPMFLNMVSKCEPQLGRRGIYQKIGGKKEQEKLKVAILWILNQSDGNTSLMDIVKKSSMDFNFLLDAANILLNKNLIKKLN